MYSFDHRGHGRTHYLKTSNTKQGHKGHIDSDKNVIMNDIGQLIGRAEDEGIEEEVPKYLIGHSLGGLMVIYYALMRDMHSISGLICLGTFICFVCILKFDIFLY